MRSACLSVCLSVHSHISKTMTAMQYVMYFRFWDNVMFSRKGWARTKDDAYVSSRSPGGSTGVKSAVSVRRYLVEFGSQRLD